MKIRSTVICSFFVACILLPVSVFSQKKKNTRPIKRPKATNLSVKAAKGEEPVYFYKFSQPKFLISKVVIEHDEKGIGKISFQKKNFEVDIVESLELSASTLEKLKKYWTALDFLVSKENYQSERDYAHLGTMKLRMRKLGKERETEFNWTDNLDARALSNEYQKIGNQFIWMFDIEVARVNQPLEAPRIMKGLDSYLRRDAISDPQQMLPFLKELVNDERMPLIARNHASRLMKKIKTSKKKVEEPAPEQ